MQITVTAKRPAAIRWACAIWAQDLRLTSAYGAQPADGREATRALHARSSNGADNAKSEDLFERPEDSGVKQPHESETGDHRNRGGAKLRIRQWLGPLTARAREYEGGSRPEDAGHDVEDEQHDNKQPHGGAILRVGLEARAKEFLAMFARLYPTF